MGSVLNWSSVKRTEFLKLAKIRPVSDEELYRLLRQLAKETDRIVFSRSFTISQCQEISQAISEIARLLQRLATLKPATNIGRLLALYSELERRVKEMRNDLGGPTEKFIKRR